MFRSKKLLTASSFIALSLLAFACGDQGKKDAIPELLNSKTGDSYVVVKNSTQVGGWAVYQDQKTGEYIAVHYSAYQQGMTYDQFVQASGGESSAFVRNLAQVDNSHYAWSTTAGTPYNGPNGELLYTGGYVWVSETDYVGGGYTFEDGNPHLKDLETFGAQLQANQIGQLRKSFVSQYGLSEARAQEVAGLVSNWSALSKKRQMTEADLKDFSKQVLGADLGSFQKAYEQSLKNGDSTQYNNLVKVAAQTNGISVEHARAILKGFLN